jgi:predicted DCC family thiol-disulfide oxidoreductase YuxK
MVSGGGKIEITDGRDLLILDGECGLCHRLANFVDRRIVDRRLLAFRASDSEDAQLVISKLPASLREADTVYLIRNGKAYIRSAAAIRCLKYMRFHWRVIYPLVWIIPLPLRDFAYGIVAKYRHMIFRRPEKCTFRID